MLTKKKQRQYLAKEEQKWLLELIAFDELGDEEALHRLRVGIKKIRALVRLSEHVRGKRLARDFRPLKKMFRQAGVIRDTRTELNVLESHQLLSAEYKERRVNQIWTVAGEFSDQIKKYRKKGKKAGRLLLADVQAIRGGRIRQWFADEIVGIGILLNASGDELHLARKKIKTLRYVHKILPKRLAAQVHVDTDYLDRLQDAIGKWHDTLVAVSDLPHAGGEVGLKRERGQDRLRQECLEKKQAIRLLADGFYRKVQR